MSKKTYAESGEGLRLPGDLSKQILEDDPAVFIPRALIKKYKIRIAVLLSCFYLDVKDNGIDDGVRTLYKKGFLLKTDPNFTEIAKLLKEKNSREVGIGHLVCEWCQVNTLILERHHFPIARKDGGEETVKICGSCHAEFHHLCRNTSLYHLKSKFLTELKPLFPDEAFRCADLINEVEYET